MLPATLLTLLFVGGLLSKFVAVPFALAEVFSVHAGLDSLFSLVSFLDRLEPSDGSSLRANLCRERKENKENK